jgi:hypothetical protein
LRASPNLAEGVESRHPKPLEITQVPRHHCQIVDRSGGGDHRVRNKLGRLSVHEPGPAAERATIHWQDIVRFSNAIDPVLDDLGPSPILPSDVFHAGLK